MSKKDLIIIAASGLVLGVLAFRWMFFMSPTSENVRVTVTNDSGYTVDTLRLRYRDGEVVLYNFYDHKETTIIFRTAGENSYDIKATLHNGTILKSNGMYVESGYATKEVIFRDTIISSY